MQGAVITSNPTLGATIDIDMNVEDAEVDALQEKIDTQAQEWQTIRRETIQQMSAIGRGINLTIQAVRTTARITGQALSPIFNGLLTLVSSTTSLVLSTATLMAASSLGVLAGVALAISVAAWTFSTIQTTKLIADSEDFKSIMQGIDAQLQALAARGSL